MVNIISTMHSNLFSAKVGWGKSQPSQKFPPDLQSTSASTPLDSFQLPKVFFSCCQDFWLSMFCHKSEKKEMKKRGGISSSGSLRNLDSRHKNKVHTQWKIGSVKIVISDLQQGLFLHFKTWLRILPIPFVEFQVWEFKISQTSNPEWMRSAETLVSFEMALMASCQKILTNDIIWYEL